MTLMVAEQAQAAVLAPPSPHTPPQDPAPDTGGVSVFITILIAVAVSCATNVTMYAAVDRLHDRRARARAGTSLIGINN